MAQLPSWILMAVVLSVFSRLSLTPDWAGGAFLALWIIKDLCLFPAMRRFYRSDLPERRMVGQLGIAVSSITPCGFVRVHGELWQARSTEPISEGATIRVCDIHGLQLRVATDPEPQVGSEPAWQQTVS